MKKFAAILFGISLCALVSMLAISPAQAYIERFTWLPPYMKKGYDSYYGEYVVIYKDGSTVNLIVPVENDWYSNGLNVSKVIVSFDWGQNKTLDLLANIEQVGWHETEIFTVSFTASATEAVSSDWPHEYTIYVEHVNATTGIVETVDETWSRPWNWWSPSYLFVVFPTDQANAYDSSQECDSYASAYPTYSFSNINASQLVGQASIKASLGDMYYTRGDYGLAETQYQTALNLYNQALAAEAEWETKVEEAELQIALTEAEANMATANAMQGQADAAMNQSYSWILFGIGFVLMGIATIVYAYRKPKVAS
jgi:tetratricopeptide (TPR) repeat protein